MCHVAGLVHEFLHPDAGNYIKQDKLDRMGKYDGSQFNLGALNIIKPKGLEWELRKIGMLPKFKKVGNFDYDSIMNYRYKEDDVYDKKLAEATYKLGYYNEDLDELDEDDNNNLSEPYYGKALSKGDIAALKFIYKPEMSRCLADWGYSPKWDNNEVDGDYNEENKKF